MKIVPLFAESGLVLTHLDGLPEEATILSIPCMALRENKEQPITSQPTTKRWAILSDHVRLFAQRFGLTKQQIDQGIHALRGAPSDSQGFLHSGCTVERITHAAT